MASLTNCVKKLSLAILIFHFSVHVGAQVCTGSLGDPLLNETFGTEHYQLPPGKTTYTPAGGCPNREEYVISGFLFGCGNNSWVQMVGDHTPDDLNGNYMMVNAESTAGTVYMDTVRNLCPNTLYQFGMWATPVMTKHACGGNAVLPNIKYQVKTLSGDILGSDSTKNLPIVDVREWKFYGFSITSPAISTDVIVNITINPPYGCGSGFAIDDITLRPCGPSISASIDGSPGPAEVCADYTSPFIMRAEYSAGFADPVLQWQASIDTGKTWKDIVGATAVNYAVPRRTADVIMYRVAIAARANITSLNCRVVSNEIYTNIHPVPPNAPLQTVIGCIGKNFSFPDADPKALQALWTGPNGYRVDMHHATIQDVEYRDTGLYTVRETFHFNCVAVDTFYLKVFPGTTISVQPVHPLCEGESEQLLASATDSVGYKWTPSRGLSDDAIPNPVASPSDSVNYKVLVTNRYGCQDSAYVPINVFRNPVANAGPDKTILIGDTAILNGTVLGTAVNYYWVPETFMNDSRLVNPLVYPPANTGYRLNVISTVGCGSSTDEVQVKVYNDFYIPNAFTPNNDGKNDVFRILMLDNYKLMRLLIYNRWGQVVFRTEGSYKGWDGKLGGLPQPNDVYIYHLELQAPSGDKITKNGTLLLTR